MTGPAFNISEGFSLGVINVYPNRNLISTGEGEVHIEPKVMDVLCLLAENSGNVVTRSDLIDRIWEVEFGADESLSRAISLLRKALRNGDETGSIIETIPKKGYMLTLPVYRMQDADHTSADPLSGNGNSNPAIAAKSQPELRPRYLALAAFTLMAAVSIAIWQIWYQPAEPELPLTAFFGITADPDDEIASAIAKSATEEIFTGLDGMGHRTVAKGQTQGVLPKQQLASAKKLDAHFSLSGRVRRDETGYVISISFNDVRDQKTLWEGTIKGSAEDRFYLPVQTADRALRATRCFNQYMPLQSSAGVQVKTAVSDLCTAEAGVIINWCQAITHARAVAALLPENPKIHSNLAVLLFGVSFSRNADEVSEKRKEAKKAATHALGLEPDDGGARFMLARMALFNGTPLAEVEAQFAAAAKVEPRNNFANSGYARFLRLVGRPNQALPYARTAMQLDPTNNSVSLPFGWTLFFASQSLEAVRWMEKQNRRDPSGQAWVGLVKMVSFLDVGDLDKAIGLKPVASPADLTRCIELMTTAGAKHLAIEVTEQCIQKKIVGEFNKLNIGVKVGDLDYAYAWAKKRFTPTNIWESGNSNVIPFLYTPKFRAMRADPRFVPLMKQAGLFDYWVTSNTSPEFCDTAEDRDSEICTAIRNAQAESS